MTELERDQEMRFEVLKAVLGEGAAARLGQLALPKRNRIETPNFLAVTSRGVVPHLTPDNVAKHGGFGGSYMALEDFIERAQKTPNRTAPVFLTPVSGDKRRLHAFTSLPSSHITVLGARRNPAVKSTLGNGNNFISVFTSTGFQSLTTEEYISAVETLRPDIAIPLADINYSSATTQTAKRGLRQAERTEDWMVDWCRSFDRDSLKADGDDIAVFAPTLPVPYSIQWEYLSRLSEDDILSSLSGLAIYDVDIAADLGSHPPLLPLPRLSLQPPSSPHHILRQISLGIDLLLVPFVNSVSDAGVALTFTFPPLPSSSSSSPDEPLPLGIDLSLPEHKVSMQPLSPGCTCYACTSHHRAYLHHLLSAREMLAWTLLQLHNHAVLSAFFAGVRASLVAGHDQFERDSRAFTLAYEAEVPAGMGTRPRARGYHFKSEGGEAKMNGPAWGRLGGDGGQDQALGKVVGVADGGVLPRDMTETPVLPDVGAMELEKEGFAEIDKGQPT